MELAASRLRQAIQPTTIDSVDTTSGATPCPCSPCSVTVASAANIMVQPSAEPHSRVRARASRTAVMSSSEPVTKWNQCGYPHFMYSSMMDRGATMLLSDPTTKKAARAKSNTWRQEILDNRPVPPVVPKTKTFMLDLDLSWCECRSSCRSGLVGRRKDVAGGRRARDVLRTLDAEVHPARVDGLEHRFGRSGLALRDAELFERCRPPDPRDGKGLDVALHDFAQLGRDFIRADHRAKLDDAMPGPRRPGQQRRHLGADIVGRDHGRFPTRRIVVDG